MNEQKTLSYQISSIVILRCFSCLFSLSLLSACADITGGEGSLEATDKIIGGDVTSAPFGIAFIQSGGSLCTASLIHPRWVLTAAHCVDQPDSASSTVVCVNENDLNRCNGNQVGVERVEIHPEWNSESAALGNDIALVKLNKALTNQPIIELATEQDTPDGAVPVRLVGYGLMAPWVDASDYQRTSVLMGLTVNSVPIDMCEDLWGFDFPSPVFCVESTPTSGVCSGDSGGPTLYQGRQVGVTSFVTVSANAEGEQVHCSGVAPAVYTRVASYLPWITQYVPLTYNLAAAAPLKPRSVSISKVTDTKLKLTWTAPNGERHTGYQVQRMKKRNGTWKDRTIVRTLGPNALKFTQSPGVGTWRYRVKAFNANGSSSWSTWKVTQIE